MTQTPQKPKIEPEGNVSQLFKPSSVSNQPQKGREKSPFPTQQKVTRSVQQASPFYPLARWFYDLPIRNKEVFVLLTGQFISVGFLLGVGVISIVGTSQTQLKSQAESELAATEINYNIKVNQMGFGFRGQSDNKAIIEASLITANGGTIPADLKQTIQQILNNELTARDIEFATLIGKDKKIIINGNKKQRSGESFDPNGLVTKVINSGEQIKTTEILSWEELLKEYPDLTTKLEPNQNVLIRYVVTPVKNPNNSKQVIGVLFAGDVVNKKPEIVSQTVEEFKGGYSGVYKINEGDKFTLATSVHDEQENQDIPLENEEILKQALANPEEVITGRTKIEGEAYTLAANIIENDQGKPVAILVRGIPETALKQLLFNSLSLQGLVAIVALVINLLLVYLLSKAISSRIESLEKTTKQFAEGNHQVKAEIRGEDEIGILANTFNQLAESIAISEDKLVDEARKAVFLQEITGSKTNDQEDVDQVFNKALKKARRLLAVDRIVVYQFNPDWSGYISHEAVDSDFPQALNQHIEDPCIPAEILQGYLNGRVVPTEDVYAAGFAPQHQALMDRLQIKANLVVPILNQGQLFGLLIAHHCSNTHPWSEDEINFLSQMAIRFGVVLDRVSLIKTQVDAAKRAEDLKEITLFLASALTRKDVLELAVNEIRPAIEADRVIVYEFDANWKGTIVAESVEEGYPKALGATIADPCFANEYVEKYQEGRVQATQDIYNAGLTVCHLKQLEPFRVKANLVAPIIVNRKLIGLLIAHQCSAPRKWEQGEIELFSQLATQVGLAIDRVNLVEAQRNSEIEQREAREKLQQRALELLMQVDPVSQGDLTIRAQVTEDEIGTIADSYNATIESLRKIVAQVQRVTIEVTETAIQNESDVSLLQEEIAEQVENIASALDRIEAMSRSSAMVSQSAEQAEEALQKAQESVEKGDIAMNRTVKSILEIRTTVQKAAEQVRKLGDASQKISNVVNLISRFAAQTHLLALKASIEAARAGEQGQGFAVIANEVRSLATQSAEATADIEKLVTEIQSETKIVVTAMEEGSEQVVEGSKLVEQTRQSLNQITAATIQINELVETIAAAAFEQSENSEEVSEKMSEVARVTEKTTASVGKLSESFRQLLDTAKELESNVAKFKVS
jgi:methyl-accepting chemotaxis protein PixJ